MRILSVTLRNYRVHRELTVDLDHDRTLIGGPNECGKSTLVEAIHNALFLRSKIGGEAQKSMVSSLWPGAPEVELGLSFGGQRYDLMKRFSGGGGATRLVRAGGETWGGDEAESRLASLLRVEAVSGGRGAAERVKEQWAHLWVWQGKSGADPADYANPQKDSLLQRLQETGGAAALQSDLDARVAAQFAALCEFTFTQAGKPKVGSNLEKAEAAQRVAQSENQNAQARIQQLQRALSDFEEANLALARAKTELETLNERKAVLEGQLKRLGELRAQEQIQMLAAEPAAKKYDEVRRGEEQIVEARAAIKQLQDSLEPKRAEYARLQEAHKYASGEADRAGGDYDRATANTRAARLRKDLCAAALDLLEKNERLAELEAKRERVVERAARRGELGRQLAALPAVDAARLKKLHALENALSQAQASLQAMATGIEVLACDEAVRVGGEVLAAGSSRIVTQETEIALGSSLRLSISPGGGTSLWEARAAVQKASEARHAALDGLGLTSVAEAAQIAEARTAFSGQNEALQAELNGLDAENLLSALEKAGSEVAGARADVGRRAAQLPEWVAPTDLTVARGGLGEAQKAADEAESNELRGKKLRDIAVTSREGAETRLSNHRQSLDGEERKLNELMGRVNLLIETHGNDELRGQALLAALTAKQQAEARLAETRAAIQELQPELLDLDKARQDRSFERINAAKQEAQVRREVSQAALLFDGTLDPEAELALTTARLQAAQEQVAGVARKAAAARLLRDLFLEEQRALADRFTRPLADKISAYLQCLFGAGATATVALTDNEIGGIQLVRSSHGGGALAFASLSGGAREQVAASVRLAMAEILAADHHGCLPVVFDDAFAYSDPDRVQTLQRMLDLAAARGLQVIVLTCNPSDYAALGANEVTLRAVRSPISAPAPGPVDMTTVVVAASHAMRQQMIERLRLLGGTAGNLALRQELGWDEGAYNGIKDDLVGAGDLIAEKGQGGGVSLSPAASEQL